MSEAPRCSLDSRYEREVSAHDGHDAHPHAPATPVPYVNPHAVSVGVPAPYGGFETHVDKQARYKEAHGVACAMTVYFSAKS